MSIEQSPSDFETELRKTASQKSRSFGFLSLTAEDHKALSSTPPQELLENIGKQQYEVMSDEDIEEALVNLLRAANDLRLFENGFAQQSHEELVKSIAFLKSVGRLPAKFSNFQTGTE
jgi:hypothetical protein